MGAVVLVVLWSNNWWWTEKEQLLAGTASATTTNGSTIPKSTPQWWNVNANAKTNKKSTSYSTRVTPTTTTTTQSCSDSLTLWRADDVRDARSAAPVGSYDYQEGICQTQKVHHRNKDKNDDDCISRCTLYFPHADLSILIQPDELLGGSTNAKQSGRSPSLLPVYDPPSLLTNYSDYNDKALLTRCGYKGRETPNQDRILLLQQEGRKQIMALFDGHGTYGHFVSHAAALDMLNRLSKSKTIYASTLTSTFLEVDTALPNAPGSGSTAIVMVQNELQVLVANLGDSQAFIAEFNDHTKETTIIYRTLPHKPHMAAERQRIEAAGGRVMLPNQPGESSRVIIPIGEMDVALAMSRSLGDREGKDSHVLTAEPVVDTIMLEPNKLYFAVAATDGIFDCLELDDVAQHLGRVMYSSSSPTAGAGAGAGGRGRPQRQRRLMDACEQLIVRSSQIWNHRFQSLYRDDISIMVSKL